MERLNKILSQRGVADSRRKADTLIQEGRVSVNGMRVSALGAKVDPETDAIEVDGTPVPPKEEPLVILLNKPKGYTTTTEDPHAEKTVYELLPAEYRTKVHHIGRLDKDSTGLLLFTNQGELTQQLTHPSHEHDKEYIVAVQGELTEEAKKKLEEGIKLDSKLTQRTTISNTSYDGERNRTTFTMVLKEGRKRQIRRMCEVVHCPVVGLQRVRMGSYVLGDLEEGEFQIFELQQ